MNGKLDRPGGEAFLDASPHRRLMVAIVALVAMTTLVYWDVGSFPFSIYDDVPNLVRNPVLQGGLSAASIRWAFAFTEVGWLPVTWLSHLLDVSLFGMDPGMHHLVNLLLHLLNTTLVFLLFRRMTGQSRESWLVAALFGIHPLHVESVAWITERKDVLSTLFWLLATDAYVRYGRTPDGRPWYFAALLCAALALMSKAMPVTLPFALLLLDFWPLGRFGQVPVRRLLLEKVPFLALSLGAVAVTLAVQANDGALTPMASFPLWARAGYAVQAYAGYLRKTVWPSGLAVYYPNPMKDVPAWKSVAASFLLLVLTVPAILQRRRRPWFTFGWFWFLGTLVPVIGLVHAGTLTMSDRYTYVPLIGLFVVVAWGLREATDRLELSRRETNAAVAACLGAIVIAARVQAGYWSDSVALFQHVIEVAGDSHVARLNLGGALSAKGRDSEALPHYLRALELRPGWTEAEHAATVTLARLGRLDEAERLFGRTLVKAMKDPESAVNVGMALAGAGKLKEAEAAFREALRLRPDFPEAHYDLGVALGRQGRKDEALPHFREALKMKPVDAGARNRIGVALMRLGRPAEALPHFREALKESPGYGEARFNLAITRQPV